MSNRLFFMLIMVLLTLLGVVSSLNLMMSRRQAVQEHHPNADVFNTRPSGYYGWHKTMEAAHIKVRVWRDDFTKLSTLRTKITMLVVLPDATIATRRGGKRPPIHPEALKALLVWVRKGNSLIVLDDFNDPAGQALLQAAGVRVSAARTATFSPVRAQWHPLSVAPTAPKTLQSYLTHPLADTARVPVHLIAISGAVQPLLRDAQHRPVLIQKRMGRGTLILGTTPDLGNNRLLLDARNDNLQFLTNLLAMANKPVMVNEYVHGHLKNGSALQYYLNTPLAHVGFQLVFLFMLAIWGGLKSWLPLRRRLAQKPPPDFPQYIRSLGHLYRRHRSARLALEPQLTRIRQRLQRRSPVASAALHNTDTDDADAEWQLNELLRRGTADYNPLDGTPAPIANDLTDGLADDTGTLIAHWQEAVAAVHRDQRLPDATVLRYSQSLTLLEERLTHGSDRQNSDHTRPLDRARVGATPHR